MTSPDPLALAAMVAYCGWDPTEYLADAVVTLDGNGSPLLTLPSLNVTGVSSVVVTDGYGDVLTYLSSDDPASIGPGRTMVGWSSDGALTCRDYALGSVWPEGAGNVVVTYSSGPVETADLDAAMAHLSARMPAMTGATSAKMGTAALTFGQTIAEGGLLLIEQMVFDRYRIPRVR